jgi:hypothetical protein
VAVRSVEGGAPQDPRDMAKAGLLEAQSPVVKCAPVGTTLVTDAEPCPVMNLWDRAPFVVRGVAQ